MAHRDFLNLTCNMGINKQEIHATFSLFFKSTCDQVTGKTYNYRASNASNCVQAMSNNMNSFVACIFNNIALDIVTSNGKGNYTNM